MSVSRHPIALRAEELVGRRAALLATVMCLPLVDGIFPALIVAGALDTWAGVVQVGLLIFGGSATVAVILADFDGTAREGAGTVLLIAVPLVALAAVEAAFAPAIAGALNMDVFHRFAALVVLAVAASTASARIAEYVPRPAVVVVLGLIASVDPTGVNLAATADPALVVRAVAAALVGVSFALVLALASPHLRAHVDLDRFRFGSAVALGLLAVGLLPAAREFGLLLGDWAPLVVLGLSALFALDPGRGVAGAPGEAGRSAEGSAAPDRRRDRPADHTTGTDSGNRRDDATGPAAADGSGHRSEDDGTERPPWL